MVRFNVGALRPAQDDACSAQLAAANDLVQRTLAQHGLLPGSGAAPQTSGNSLPDMHALMARLRDPSAGTASVPVPDGAQFKSGSFTCASGTRAYRTYVPAAAAQGVDGVIMMLHGCTQTADDFAIGTGMNALAEMHRLVVVYPQQSRGDNAQSCWNWFSPGDQRKGRGEPAILAGIQRQVMAEFAIPRDRSFAAGLSAGGAMAMILGRTYGDVISAVGVHSGLPHGAARDVPSAYSAMAGNAATVADVPADGPSVRCIVFHGTADATVHPSNADAVARQVLQDAPRTIETETGGRAGGRSYRRRIATTPEGVTLLESWSIDGMAHAWSGGQPGGTCTDARGPDASAEMLRFFLNAEDI